MATNIRSAALVCVQALALLLAQGCKRNETAPPESVQEPGALATTIHVADPRVSAQLVSGWYEVEQSAWRWTAGRFSVNLRPPRSAAANGAVLQLKFSIPDVLIQKLGPVTLSASVNGAPLTPETYAQAGEFVYARDVPAQALQGAAVKVDFLLDKTLPPSSVDKRELGVIATTAGFESK